jgi:tetraacyldisaccharide 4'-kinase
VLDPRLEIARRLESGAFDGALSRAASRAWARVAEGRLARPLVWPRERRLVTVGGATLGGSGKTRLALACVEHLAERGVRVALVGHAYRARPGDARVVEPTGDPRVVGDEALACAREVSEAGTGAVVVVGPTRQRAVNLAARVADVLVVDGALQTAPCRADLALLALDRLAPWGARACPPAGDLRAPVAALVAAADAVVAIGPQAAPWDARTGTGALLADELSEGAHFDGRLLDWDALRAARVGLYTAVARPERLVARLELRGVSPVAVVTSADHAPPSAAALRAAERAVAEHAVDLWVATPKCRTHLAASALAACALGGAPVATLDDRVRLPSLLATRLDALAAEVSAPPSRRPS